MCMRNDTKVEDAECADLTISPSLTDACKVKECGSYWKISDFGACSVAAGTCGTGTRSRTVQCFKVESGRADTQNDCTAPKPFSSQLCNTLGCPTYFTSDWQSCSRECGEGVQNRTVECRDRIGRASDKCTGAVPIATQGCENGPCPHWHRHSWQECDKPCGGGSQERDIICRFPHGAKWLGKAVPAHQLDLCPAVQPAGTQACNVDICAAFYWKTTED